MPTLLKRKNGVIELVQQEIEEYARYLPRIAQEERGVFRTRLHRKLQDLDSMSRFCPEDRSELMKCCVQACAPELTQSHIYDWCINKPLGYAGDFQAIEYIYDYKAESPGRGRLWDEYFHAQVAPQAVRNRKDLFGDLFLAVCQKTPASRSVLDIASGPCREVIDAVKRAGTLAKGTLFHCVDIEEKAIAYSKGKVRGLEHVSFQWETANVLRIRPDRQYDLVWSAGLFDYLNDRLATLLLNRMWHWTKTGGRCVIGNFHTSNPTRSHMEWCGDWVLIHRTDEDMQRLCSDADIPLQNVEITHEPLGAIVFAVARK